MEIKEETEKYILWKIGKGNLSFWWDNWTGQGALANLGVNYPTPKGTKVQQFIRSKKWDVTRLQAIIPHRLVRIIRKIKIHPMDDDRPVWTLEQSGKFSCNST